MDIEQIIHHIVGQIRNRLDVIDSNPTKEELDLFISEIGSKVKIRAMIQAQFDALKAENTERSRQALVRNEELETIDLENII